MSGYGGQLERSDSESWPKLGEFVQSGHQEGRSSRIFPLLKQMRSRLASFYIEYSIRFMKTADTELESE